MRWIRIRKPAIDPELRKTFERYGTATMQMILATTNYFQHLDKQLMAQNVRDDLLPWLTEQYDRAERKETWSLTMDAAIRSEEHTSELQSLAYLVCRLLLEKKN